MRRLTETSFFRKVSESSNEEEVSDLELQALFDEFAIQITSLIDSMQENRRTILRILSYTTIRLQALLERANRAGKKCANS